MLSPKLLKYYMCTIVPIVQQCLMDMGVPQSEVHPKEVVHMFLRERFAPAVEEWSDKEMKYIVLPRSVESLDNTQFFRFKEDIQRWAVEFLGVYIPDPNEEVRSWIPFP